VVPRILGGLDELGDDVLRRRHVGVAHAEVDDVLAAGSRLRLQVVDDREDVGGQTLDPIEVVHRSVSSPAMIQNGEAASQRMDDLSMSYAPLAPGIRR
jgi:hypothetical protein